MFLLVLPCACLDFLITHKNLNKRLNIAMVLR